MREIDGVSLYYDPAGQGFEILATLEDDQPWEFDIVLLLRDTTDGKIYVAQDAGCSCPSPFEDVRSTADLTEVRTAAEVDAFVKSFEYAPWKFGDVLDFAREAREVLA